MNSLRISLNRTLSRLKRTGSAFYLHALLWPAFVSGKSVATHHFRERNLMNHINRIPFTLALHLLRKRKSLIVETGSSAWGTDSTKLWARYVTVFGGQLFSVDIAPEPSRRLGDLGCPVSLVVEDSVSFLCRFQLPNGFTHIDLLFLDSWDVNLSDPRASMNHGLAELRAAMPFLRKGSLILVDDTPFESRLYGEKRELAEMWQRKTGLIPGKGALILSHADLMSKFEILMHNYSLLLRHR